MTSNCWYQQGISLNLRYATKTIISSQKRLDFRTMDKSLVEKIANPWTKVLSDDASVHTECTEIDSVVSNSDNGDGSFKVFRVDGDCFSLLSQHDLSYADFSHVVEDENESVCSLLTYSTMSSESTEASHDSKLENNSGILSGTIFVTQMTKKDLRSKFEIKDEKTTAVNEGKVTFSRIEELRMKKNNIETKYTSSQESKITEISDKVSQDELDCVTLEKSIAASSKRMLVTAAVCIPLFPFLCGILSA